MFSSANMRVQDELLLSLPPGRAGWVTLRVLSTVCVSISFYISSNSFSGAMRLCPKQLRGGALDVVMVADWWAHRSLSLLL